jgi:hypothetical protein
MRLGRAVLTLVTLGAGCGGSDRPQEVTAPPRPPCADVYASTYNTCVSDSNCAGLECLYVMQYCAANARRDAALCCGTNFPNPADYQQCVDSLGMD